MEELLATCRLILMAGHETTVNLIGNGVVALLRHPEERAALAADPALLPGAVEELLRYDSPVQMTMRFAFAESPIGPHLAKRGDLVMVLLGAANRDPAEYEEPARLDIRRADAPTHLSFGGGIHYCLGASLARAEGQIAVGALLRRLPRLALGGEPLAWRPAPVFRGLSALPVTF
jgi:pimeloyl-[acyl-carrier protein] synthase